MTAFSCPRQIGRYDRIVLGHGGGGRLTHELIDELFAPAFGSTEHAREDQAIVPGTIDPSHRLAITTDSFVVSPIFFPGGDIGTLAVAGTVNDLVVGGARPLYLSASFILEEGLAIADLARVVQSMQRTAQQAGVAIVTGDTKVVERGKADRLFITTTGVGIVPPGVALSAANARPGDRVLVSGPIGDHGMAIMSVRAGIAFETELQSDCAPLHDLVHEILTAAPAGAVRCLRDATRGGVGAVLNELACASQVDLAIEETQLPVRAEVKSACEILGLDPIYVACEGRVVVIVAAEAAATVLAAMRNHPLGQGSADIGRVEEPVQKSASQVVLRTSFGARRIVALLSGEQLPRIC
jgi:hydrogenase expression/formation protein HypE